MRVHRATARYITRATLCTELVGLFRSARSVSRGPAMDTIADNLIIGQPGVFERERDIALAPRGTVYSPVITLGDIGMDVAPVLNIAPNIGRMLGNAISERVISLLQQRSLMSLTNGDATLYWSRRSYTRRRTMRWPWVIKVSSSRLPSPHGRSTFSQRPTSRSTSAAFGPASRSSAARSPRRMSGAPLWSRRTAS